jgi:DNA-directed RNA polymerase subunit alpha
MVDTILIDLKALMVEREDCDAGTVEKLRSGLAQGKTQYRALRESAESLKKKVEANAGTGAGKRWHLKLGIAQYFLGHLSDAIENFKLSEGALANFYLGKALLEKQQLDEAFKAFEKAEKAGYNVNQVKLQ